MAIGEFNRAESDEALEALRRMFNAIAPQERKNNLTDFSRIGTFIQAAQRTFIALGAKPGDQNHG
jgi:hypothetical protein